MTELIVNFVLMSASINVVMILLKTKFGEATFFKKTAIIWPHLMGVACGVGYALYYEQFVLSGILAGFLGGSLATSNYDLVKMWLERKTEEI